jgi:hypothetical protein
VCTSCLTRSAQYTVRTLINEHSYTIAWKQSLPSIPLEGIVEYKSLPSGLHNVKSDLVYFVHEQEFAGVSAFQNVEASAGERNARFISVGALVRLGDGRLGRAWEHAGALKELAEQVVVDIEDVKVLEEYWDRWRDNGSGEDEEGARNTSSAAKRRSRALSSLTLGGSQAFKQRLPPYHPAYSILGYLDTFGPLAFPLHRLALLRKRVLVITPVPVKAPCEYGMLLLSACWGVLDRMLTSIQSTTCLYYPPCLTRSCTRHLPHLSLAYDHSSTLASTIYRISPTSARPTPIPTKPAQKMAAAGSHAPQTRFWP